MRTQNHKIRVSVSADTGVLPTSSSLPSGLPIHTFTPSLPLTCTVSTAKTEQRNTQRQDTSSGHESPRAHIIHSISFPASVSLLSGGVEE